jgi:hypothetical protein
MWPVTSPVPTRTWALAAGSALARPDMAEAFESLGDLLSEIASFAALLVFGALITPDRLSYLWARAVPAIVLVRPAALLRTPLSGRECVAAWFGPKVPASVVYGLLTLQSGIADREVVLDRVAVKIALSIVVHSSTEAPDNPPTGRQAGHQENDRSSSCVPAERPGRP